jgi:hypothetical protein
MIRNFPLRYRVQTGSGDHPASLMGTRGFIPRGKRPGTETHHSSASSAEDKNAWSYTSNPPLRLHGVVIN